MSDFILRWRSRCCNTVKFQGMCLTPAAYPNLTYHIPNLASFSIDLDTPIDIIRLPQQGAECTFVIKTQGNAQTMNVSWTIINETGNIVTMVDELDGNCGREGPVLTVCSQIDFLFNTMENRGINHEWDFFVGDSDYQDDNMCMQLCVAPGACMPVITDAQSNTAFNSSSEFRRHAKLSKLVVSKSSATPVTYTANLSMVVGERLLTVDESCQPAETCP